ncbi:HlyD family secretion protein [Thiotrichales bacterium 19S11-10]|nr:HlyD family secretion protein [Thiotrichales bacterium 19S11-10]
MKRDLQKIIKNKYIHRILIIITIIVLYIFYHWYFYYNTSTNYAFTWANTINVSSEVSGQIEQIYVKDYGYVKKGDKILSIDPKPFQYAYNKAKANYDEVKISYQMVQHQIEEANAKLKQATLDQSEANDHFKRISKLYQNKATSEVDYINAKTTLEKTIQAVVSATNNLEIIKSKANQNELNKAQADYDLAKYNLDHTIIISPSDGYVVNLLAQPGSYINDAIPLFGIIETNTWWVVGRFRETVLRHIHIGDKAEVTIDMYPNQKFYGYVDRIGWGINRRESSPYEATSTLPYIQATEYWIRLAQRFPVWVKLTSLDSSTALRVGGNATVEILDRQQIDTTK